MGVLAYALDNGVAVGVGHRGQVLAGVAAGTDEGIHKKSVACERKWVSQSSRYTELERGVARIDAERGRTFDGTSERLTMSALHDAKATGITSADYVAINQTGKRQQNGTQIAGGDLLFVVQGQDPSDPAARRSITDVAQAVDRPVEQSLQKVDALAQQQSQVLAQQQSQPVQDEPSRMHRMA